jgi:hypothetical protein
MAVRPKTESRKPEAVDMVAAIMAETTSPASHGGSTAMARRGSTSSASRRGRSAAVKPSPDDDAAIWNQP